MVNEAEDQEENHVTEDERWAPTGIFRLCVLLLIMCFMVGVSPGYAAIRPALLDGHTYANKCDDVDPLLDRCQAQDDELARIANLSFVLLNASALLCGLAIDYIGPYVAATLSTFLWIIFTIAMGIDPPSGYGFAIGFIGQGVTCALVFLCILGSMTRGLLPKRYSGVPGALLTGFWDVGAVTFVILREIYYQSHPSLLALFSIYGLVVGVPALLFFACTVITSRRLASPSSHGPPGTVSAVRASNPASTADTMSTADTAETRLIDPSDETSDHAATPLLQSTAGACCELQDFKALLGRRLYWIYTANAAALVAYGYLWIALLPYHMTWKGMDDAEADDYSAAFALMLPLLGGGISVVCGFMLDFSRAATLVRAWRLQSCLAVVMGVLACLPSPQELQYATMAAIVTWRINGFAVINASFIVVFPDTKIVGRAMGLMYTIAGLCGIAVGQTLVPRLTSDGTSFLPVHISLSTYSAVVAAAAAWAV